MVEMSVGVLPGDIDRLGHVNNGVYLRWIEQAVHNHWLDQASAAERESFEWIAVRHEIDYRRQAFLDEELQVRMHLESVRRARAWFRTVIVRGEDVIVEALSCWCCIDAGSGRLALIPPETRGRFETSPAPSLS